MQGREDRVEGVRGARESGSREGGFTLLEVTLALMLIVILMGGIYSIATGALQLGAEVSEAQNREMLVHSFLQLCRRNIEGLPGNAGMTLFAEESGRFYVTEVSFLKDPLAFSFAAVPGGHDKVELVSEADPRGYLRVSLRYLNELEGSLEGVDVEYDEENAIVLPLLEGVGVFEWRFYDNYAEDWKVIWEDETERPSFVELTLGFIDESEPIRAVFWLPPVANPETALGGGGVRAGEAGEAGGEPAEGEGAGGPGRAGVGPDVGPGGDAGGGGGGGPRRVQPRLPAGPGVRGGAR